MTDPQIFMHLTVSVKKGDGNALERSQPMSFANNLLMSLFRTAEVVVGSTSLPCSQNANPYVQYLYSLLSYGKGAQDTLLQPSMWFRDAAMMFDANSANAIVANKGAASRSAWVHNGPMDLFGPLQLDICKMSRLLLNRLSLNLKLYRATDQFVLLTFAENTVQYRVSIDRAELMVRRVRPRAQDIKWLETELAKRAARYPLVMNTMITYSMPKGSQNVGEYNDAHTVQPHMTSHYITLHHIYICCYICCYIRLLI